MLGTPLATNGPMPKSASSKAKDSLGQHGAMRLPGLKIDSYNLVLREPDGEGFVGDRASQTAFRDLLDARRSHHRTGKDPFGKTPTAEIGKKEIDLVLVGGDADAAHLVHAAVEDYAQRLAEVVLYFLSQPEWHKVTRIVLGGGFPDSKVGGLAIRRAARLLKRSRAGVELCPLQHDSDDAGLLGWVQLASKLARKHDTFLAVDIGGSNIRCGIVEHRLARAKSGAKARVVERSEWRHADDDPKRGEAVTRLAGMLNGLIAQARTTGIDLAPFVGIACPGRIETDGGIAQGAQNLPGDWETPAFNLPGALLEKLDAIDGRVAAVVMHNDAVVQGLSERPRMEGTRRWGVLTIGTGLGNASYSQADH
jgi:hypothetical protein